MPILIDTVPFNLAAGATDTLPNTLGVIPDLLASNNSNVQISSVTATDFQVENLDSASVATGAVLLRKEHSIQRVVDNATYNTPFIIPAGASMTSQSDTFFVAGGLLTGQPLGATVARGHVLGDGAVSARFITGPGGLIFWDCFIPAQATGVVLPFNSSSALDTTVTATFEWSYVDFTTANFASGVVSSFTTDPAFNVQTDGTDGRITVRPIVPLPTIGGGKACVLRLQLTADNLAGTPTIWSPYWSF